MTTKSPSHKDIADVSGIEVAIDELGLPGDISALLLRRCVEKSLSGERDRSPDSIRAFVADEAKHILNDKLGDFETGEKIDAPPVRAAFFTGQFNPPTRGHEAFIRNLLATEIPVIIAGPDSERTGDSGTTPMSLRRHLFLRFMQRVFPDELETGRLRLYPTEMAGGSYPDRREKWRQFEGQPAVFSCGADTLRDIIIHYPETVISGPIICMRRGDGETGESVKLPAVSKEFFIELMQKIMQETGSQFQKLFKENERLAPMIQKWCMQFPRIPADQTGRFIKQQKTPPDAFAHQLTGSERLASGGPKIEAYLRRILEKFIIYAKLATDPYELARLESHIFYVDTKEDADSSTRDRNWLKHLPEIDAVLEKRLLQTEAEENPEKIRTDADATISVIRSVAHYATLEILCDEELTDIYSERVQRTRIAVTNEIILAARELTPRFRLIDPEIIAALTPPAQFALARSIAGVRFEWEHASADPRIHIPKHVHSQLAHSDNETNFIPSILIDESGNIIAMLIASHFRSPPLIKYSSVQIDPKYSNNAEIASLVNEMVKQRISADRESDHYGNADIMIVEAPAHNARLVEQHILGGTGFIPCGLEPGTYPSESHISCTVQGMHVRNLQNNQGNYYVTKDAVPLISAINKFIEQEYRRELRYQFVHENLDSTETKNSDYPTEEPQMLRKTKDELVFQLGNMTFSIYLSKSRQLDIDDFRDKDNGHFLLADAVKIIEKLIESGEIDRSYIKIEIPIDSPHSIQLQRTLIDNGFLASRFTPRTKRMPATLTFCKMIGGDKKVTMNTIELPISRIPGDPGANTIFSELQRIGEKFLALGKVKIETQSSTPRKIEAGKRQAGRSEIISAIVGKAHWEVFPTLYIHYFECIETLMAMLQNPIRVDIPKCGDGGDHVKLMRLFIGLHDSGKAIWAMLNRFSNTLTEEDHRPMERLEIERRLKEFLTQNLDEKKEPFSPDWDLAKAKINVEEIAGYLQYDSAKKRYAPIADERISADLIRKYIGDETTFVPQGRYERLVQCADFYESFASVNIDNLESENKIPEAIKDPKIFYFLLLELIDNVARYKITDQAGKISIREIWNALDLKQQEVMARYGTNQGELAQERIIHKFELLKKTADVFFGELKSM